MTERGGGARAGASAVGGRTQWAGGQGFLGFWWALGGGYMAGKLACPIGEPAKLAVSQYYEAVAELLFPQTSWSGSEGVRSYASNAE